MTPDQMLERCEAMFQKIIDHFPGIQQDNKLHQILCETRSLAEDISSHLVCDEAIDAKMKRYEECLRWYATEASQPAPMGSEWGVMWDDDLGARARETLKHVRETVGS